MGWLVTLKIRRKYGEFLFAALTSVVMSFIITFIITLVNTGLAASFWSMWIRGFLVGSAVSIPISLLAIPVVRRIVDKLTSA